MSLSSRCKLGITLDIKHQTILGQKRIIVIRKHIIRFIRVAIGPITKQPLILEVYILRLLIGMLRFPIRVWRGPESIGRIAHASIELLTRRMGHAIRWIVWSVKRRCRGRIDFSLTLRGLEKVRITVVALFILHSWRQVVQQKNTVYRCRWRTGLRICLHLRRGLRVATDLL